jgi:hypothetical protein
MFCEAPADFQLASGLVDRVLRELAPAWVADNFESPEVIRTWQPDGFGRTYFDIHDLNRYMDRLQIRGVRGHFNGRPGRAGGAMARKAFLIAHAVTRTAPDKPIDAVVLVWDMDEQRDERTQGVEAARDEAQRWARFQIVCGYPDPEREAWVLAGFEPCDDDEKRRLDALHRDLGFSPVHHAAQLRDRRKGALRDIKRVLEVLTGGITDRESRCWTEPSLATLRDRGTVTGLTAFLEDLEAAIPRLLAPRHARSRPT